MGKKAKTAAVVIGTGVKVAAKYGPQAKIAWDNGGRKAAASAARKARSLTARRKAMTHAATVVDGSVLKVAPAGTTAYVVFSGDEPIATFPPLETPYSMLLAHADLTKRVRPEPGDHRSLPRGRR
ncbi:hypothetical protein ncot_15910 [Nocardioides sp. JQ2195]|uniref:hypothetical protein n=1 Tax=Nocardioides sp. JQ2195 TaxID=2592334 RepID=UPI00143E4413|nr:hypothetical protein [Nocardioides sp. JQ2195]QIX27905.1 hypothetical protein ncot_15910 [Nocardioides sp. JQ2195]